MKVKSKVESKFKLNFELKLMELSYSSRLLTVIAITLLISGLCQSAPAKREIWNPYYYPTVRSIISVAALKEREILQEEARRSLETTTTKMTTPITTSTKTTRATTRPPIITTRRPRSLPKPTQARSNINRRAAKAKLPAMTANIFDSILPANNSQKFLGIDVENFNLGNYTAINIAMFDFIKQAELILRELLVSTQTGLLKVIGQVDQGADKFQRRLQDSSVRLALAGQRAAAVTYESLPSFVNKLLQRLTTPTDDISREKLTVQLNTAIKNLRDMKKQFVKAFEEHEVDFHNVFTDRFKDINQYLRVPELPRRPFGWFS